MPILYRLIKAALDPLIFMNCLGMLGAGVFIVYKGPWQVLWFCTLVFFISPLVFPLLMMPAGFFGGIMQMFTPTRPRLALVMQAASVGWLIFVIAGWAALVFSYTHVLLEMPGMLWAALIWSVCGAVAPWAVFARLDRGNVFFTGLMLMAQIGCIIAAMMNASHDLSSWETFEIIAGVMAFLSAVQAVGEDIFLKDKTA